MASGATGHQHGLKRPPLRTVRSVALDDEAATKNNDAVSDAIGDIPTTYYTEGQLLSGSTDADIRKKVVTFTASTLDQTLAHRLGGECKAAIVGLLTTAGTFPVVVQAAVVAPKTSDKFIRLVANAECVATIWCWRP